MKTEIVDEPRIEGEYIVINVSVEGRVIPILTREDGVHRGGDADGKALAAAIAAAKSWVGQNQAKADAWYQQLARMRGAGPR